MPQIKDSLYEQLNPLTTVAGQHFVEDFSGDTLDTFRWNDTTSGSASVSMSDSVDGGVLVDASATNGGQATINFNLLAPFDYSSSSIIYVAKFNEIDTNAFETYAGLGTINTIGGGSGAFTYKTGTGNTNWQLATTGGSLTFTPSSITADNSRHVFQHILSATNVILKIDGVVAVVNTTNLPATKLQPVLGLNTSSDNSKTMNITYCEAWNIA